jgi:hypothetical protein
MYSMLDEVKEIDKLTLRSGEVMVLKASTRRPQRVSATSVSSFLAKEHTEALLTRKEIFAR